MIRQFRVVVTSIILSASSLTFAEEGTIASDSSELSERVSEAQEAYASKDFGRAKTLFDRAAFLAETDSDRATLTFNAAVAAFEEKDYLGAETRFVAAARLDPSTRNLCFLEAGLVAIERGDLSKAEEYRALALEGDPSTTEKRAELDNALRDLRSARARNRISIEIERAESAYKAGQSAEAKRAIEHLESDRTFLRVDELDFIDLLRAYLAHDAADLVEARRHYEVVLTRSPGHIDARLGLGDLFAEEKSPSLALEQYRLAKNASTKPEDRERSEKRIYALYPLSPERFLVTARADFGYDSNAAQSGSASRTGFAAVAKTESPFFALQLAIERPLRLGEHSSLNPYYFGNATFLTDSRVRDYSIQGHELGLLYNYAFTPTTLLRVGTSADVYLVGLESQSLFLSEIWFGSQFLFDHSKWASLRLGVNIRREIGLSGRNSLSGVRSDFEVRETFHFGSFHPFVHSSAISNDIGTQVVPLRDLSLALCGGPPDPSSGRPVCDEGAEYHIPLGYGALAFGTGVDFDPFPSLRLSLSAKIEARKYASSSFILLDPGGPAPPGPERLNEKIRADLRGELRASLQYKLDRAGTFTIPLDFWGLASSSNIAQTPGDPEHALDYDNRRFTQLVGTLGLRYAN